MTDEEYLAAQTALIVAARMLDQHDWTAFFNRIDHAETVGVFLFAPADYVRATSLTKHIASMSLLASRLVKTLHELDAEAATKRAVS